MSDSRQVILGQTVALEMEIKDANGINVDPDTTPEVAILDPYNSTIRPSSSTDITRMDVGKFRFNYSVPVSANTGIWTDRWTVVLNGFSTTGDLNFIVLTASAEISAAGEKLGDIPTTLTGYTQEEIHGINILLEMLNYRLKNKLEVETTDAYGNIGFTTCTVFTTTELVWFLQAGLTEFNEFPHFTDFTFADDVIYGRYAYVIVEGALIVAWAAQMILEAGREFSITDNGITQNLPPLSATLNNELSQFVSAHRELIKNIKYSIKPKPVGFGTYRILASNPNLLRLRHLRERQII